MPGVVRDQDGTDCESVPSDERIQSFKWVTKLGDWSAAGSFELSGQRAEALHKRLGPFIERLQNDPSTDPTDEYLSVTVRKPAFSRKPNRLAAAVLEELRAR